MLGETMMLLRAAEPGLAGSIPGWALLTPELEPAAGIGDRSPPLDPTPSRAALAEARAAGVEVAGALKARLPGMLVLANAVLLLLLLLLLLLSGPEASVTTRPPRECSDPASVVRPGTCGRALEPEFAAGEGMWALVGLPPREISLVFETPMASGCSSDPG